MKLTRSQVDQDKQEAIKFMPLKLSYADAAVYNINIDCQYVNRKLDRWILRNKLENTYAPRYFSNLRKATESSQ